MFNTFHRNFVKIICSNKSVTKEKILKFYNAAKSVLLIIKKISFNILKGKQESMNFIVHRYV